MQLNYIYSLFLCYTNCFNPIATIGRIFPNSIKLFVQHRLRIVCSKYVLANNTVQKVRDSRYIKVLPGQPWAINRPDTELPRNELPAHEGFSKFFSNYKNFTLLHTVY